MWAQWAPLLYEGYPAAILAREGLLRPLPYRNYPRRQRPRRLGPAQSRPRSDHCDGRIAGT
eukprot:363445-Hanusia_phi.AAC.1